jgi:hypothetical protein
MTPEIAAARLSDIFGINISVDHAAKAMAELATYSDLQFETLEGKYKINGDCYILLSVINNQQHNGTWQRYIDHLKATQNTIIVQEVVNDRLMGWLLRNGFARTKKHKDWVIWKN